MRLERDEACLGRAQGPPIAKGDKRLAVQTEVHPLEYGRFEGTIPEGNYGAGEVRIFDDGWYEPVEWTDTKVSFVLHGRRYPGLEFHFVKTKTDWLAFLASGQTHALIAQPPRLDPMFAEGGWRAFDDRGGGSSRSSTASDAWPSSRRARPCCARARGVTRPSSTRSCTWSMSSSTR